jgi:hypothetical protein
LISSFCNITRQIIFRKSLNNEAPNVKNKIFIRNKEYTREMDNFLQQLNKHPRQVAAIAQDVEEYLRTHNDFEIEIASSIPVLSICAPYMKKPFVSRNQTWAAFCLTPTPDMFHRIVFPNPPDVWSARKALEILILYWKELRKNFTESERNKAFHKLLNEMAEGGGDNFLMIPFLLNPEWPENDILAWKRQLPGSSRNFSTPSGLPVKYAQWRKQHKMAWQNYQKAHTPPPFDAALALRWHALANRAEFIIMMSLLPPPDRIRLIKDSTSSNLLKFVMFDTLKNTEEKVAFFHKAILDPAVDAFQLSTFFNQFRIRTAIELVCDELSSKRLALHARMEDLHKAFDPDLPRHPFKNRRTLPELLKRLRGLLHELKRLYRFAAVGAPNTSEVARLDSAYNKLGQTLRHAFKFDEHLVILFTNPLPVHGASHLRWETQNPDSFQQFFQSYVRQYLVTHTLEMFENTEVIVDKLSQVYSIDSLMRNNQSALRVEDEAAEEEEEEDYEDYEEDEDEDEDDFREIEPWEHPSHP